MEGSVVIVQSSMRAVRSDPRHDGIQRSSKPIASRNAYNITGKDGHGTHRVLLSFFCNSFLLIQELHTSFVSGRGLSQQRHMYHSLRARSSNLCHNIIVRLGHQARGPTQCPSSVEIR